MGGDAGDGWEILFLDDACEGNTGGGREVAVMERCYSPLGFAADFPVGVSQLVGGLAQPTSSS